ncbi:MAG: hypothetical protein RIR90_1978 [Bacteroidota bacterium]|jgi:hypothetical protein
MRKAFLLLLAGAFFTNIQAQELKLAKGQKFQTTTITKTAMNQQMMGQSLEMNTDITAVDEIEVVDVNDKNITLSKTAKQLKSSFSGMGQSMDFDSNKPEDLNGPVGSQMKRIINTPLNFVLNPSGTIAEAPKMTGNAMMNMAGDVAKGEAMPGFIAIPAGIKAGDSFSITGADGDNKTIANYTVVSVNGKEVALKMNITANKTNTVNQMGMDMLMTLKMTTTGNATVDVASGFMLSASTETTTDGTINVMGQSVPMTIKTTSTITGKKL